MDYCIVAWLDPWVKRGFHKAHPSTGKRPNCCVNVLQSLIGRHREYKAIAWVLFDQTGEDLCAWGSLQPVEGGRIQFGGGKSLLQAYRVTASLSILHIRVYQDYPIQWCNHVPKRYRNFLFTSLMLHNVWWEIQRNFSRTNGNNSRT